MNFLGRIFHGIGAEFRGIYGVLKLLYRSQLAVLYFYLLIGCVVVATGIAPAWVGEVGGLLAAACGIFSGSVALWVRRRRMIAYADGPDVVPYLPQLITLLTVPLSFLCMVGFFARTFTNLETGQPVPWSDALFLAVDNVVRTELFFDTFEIFHVRFGFEVSDFTGLTIIFVSRLLLDIAFAKLAIQILSAAYFRARGLGRGEDKLFQLKKALQREDVAEARLLAKSVGDSLREAVEALLAHRAAGGPEGERAWRCLVTMKEFALPYLERQTHTAAGAEGERLRQVVRELRDAEPAAEPNRASRFWLLPLLGLALTGAVVGLFWLAPLPALAASVALAMLLAWMVVGARGWLDRLVGWHALPAPAPNRLPLAVAGWALALLPLLAVADARLFQAAPEVVPGVFGATPAQEVDYPSALGFVLENLTRTQIFVDTANIYGLKVVQLEQAGLAGGLLTLFVRTVFSLGIIGVLVAFAAVWFNRVFRRFAVTPNAELALRSEADECGPHAPLLVGYHYREIRDYLLGRMRWYEQHADLLRALAASGFLGYQSAGGEEPPAADELPEDEGLAHLNVAEALLNQYQAEEALGEFRVAGEALALLVGGGRADLRPELVFTWTGQARACSSLRRWPEAEDACRQALVLLEALAEEDPERYPDLVGVHTLLGNVLRDRGNLAEGIAQLRHAVGLADHAPPERRQALELPRVRALFELGRALDRAGREEEAAAEYRRLIEVGERAVGRGETEFAGPLLAGRAGLAKILADQGHREESVAEFRRAIAAVEDRLREGEFERRTQLLSLHGSLASVLCELARLDEAAAEYRAAVAVCHELLLEGHGQLGRDLIVQHRQLGSTLSAMGRPAEAAEEFRHVIDLTERLGQEALDDPEQYRLGVRLLLADQLVLAGREAEAEAEWRAADARAAELEAGGGAEFREHRAAAGFGLWAAYHRQKRGPEADAALREATGLLEELPDAGANDEVAAWLADAFFAAGRSLLLAGHVAAAAAVLSRAAVRERSLADKGYAVRRALEGRNFSWAGDALGRLGRWEEAESYQRRAIAVLDTLLRGGRADLRLPLAASYHHLGLALKARQRWDESAEAFRRAVEVEEAGHQPGSATVAVNLHYLGFVLGEAGRAAEAEEALRRSLAVREQVSAAGQDQRPALADTREQLSRLLAKTGRRAEAADELGRAIGLYETLVNEGRSDLTAALARASESREILLGQRSPPPAPEAGKQPAPAPAPPAPPGTAGTINDRIQQYINAGRTLSGQGRLAEAAEEYGRAAELGEGLLREGASNSVGSVAQLHALRAAALRDLKHWPEAAAAYRRAVELTDESRRAGGPRPPALLEWLGSLARSEEFAGRLPEAAEAIRRSVADMEGQIAAGETSLRPTLAHAHIGFGRVLLRLGQGEEAVGQLKQAVVIAGPLARDGEARAYAPLVRGWAYLMGLAAGANAVVAEQIAAVAVEFLQTLVPKKADLPPDALAAIRDFLKLAQAKGIAAEQTGALANEFAPPA